MSSTPERSFVKGVVWEGISFIITAIFAYFYYGNWYNSFRFSFFLTVIKIFFFFIHERVWKMFKWGKY
jgi:hypothetical protein